MEVTNLLNEIIFKFLSKPFKVTFLRVRSPPKRKWLSLGMFRRVVYYNNIDVSDVIAASTIFDVMMKAASTSETSINLIAENQVKKSFAFSWYPVQSATCPYSKPAQSTQQPHIIFLLFQRFCTSLNFITWFSEWWRFVSSSPKETTVVFFTNTLVRIVFFTPTRDQVDLRGT